MNFRIIEDTINARKKRLDRFSGKVLLYNFSHLFRALFSFSRIHENNSFPPRYLSSITRIAFPVHDRSFCDARKSHRIYSSPSALPFVFAVNVLVFV